MPPAPTAEHGLLDAFIGTWTSEGRSKPSPFDPDVPDSDDPLPVQVHGTHSYEWLPGRFFVVHQWEWRVGNVAFTGMWIMGYDPEAGAHWFQLFDDSGNHVTYSATVDDRVWTVTGEQQRATLEFAPDGNSVRHRWFQRDGQEWMPICDITATRVE